MQAHQVRNLKGKLLFLALISAILMIAMRSDIISYERDDGTRHQSLIQSQYEGGNISRMPTRKKQTPFALELTENEVSFLENYIFDSSMSESSFDSSYYSDNVNEVAKISNGSFPYVFTVNETTNHFQHGCYTRGPIKGIKELLPADKLSELGCTQRPPEAIVFGVKKGGTTTLKEFLSFHPGVSVSREELKFLNNKHLHSHGLQKYASLMPFSLPGQIPIEKTPGYLVRPKCAPVLKELIPDCKLIAILSDPIHRAISDYVHLSWVRDNRINGASEMLPKHAHQMPHYEVMATFEESVMYSNGSLKTWNTLLDTGVYYKHAKYWLQFFPPENFLYLDSNDLIHEPVKTFKELEKYLSLPPFFSESIFHFNETKGFYCIQYPIATCMPSAKGRPHPVVDEAVLRKLEQYFEPYNKQFSELVNKTFSWTTYSSR